MSAQRKSSKEDTHRVKLVPLAESDAAGRTVIWAVDMVDDARTMVCLVQLPLTWTLIMSGVTSCYQGEAGEFTQMV